MSISLQPAIEMEESTTFGKTEEYAIISLVFDQPEFFSAILPYLKDEFFEQFETKFVFNIIKYHFEKHGVLVSRNMCLDIVLQSLTADDPHEEIIKLVQRESDPREVPIITDKLMEWARKKAYGQLYSQEAIEAHERGEYALIEQILDDAHKITNVNAQCHFMFNELDSLFQSEQIERFTTGFPLLDSVLNNGGPTRKEVVVFMAPTGVGKSIVLVNCGASCIRRSLNVLHVTLELSWVDTALRYMGCFTEVPIRNRFEERPKIEETLRKIRATYGANLIITDFPPDEISVDSIHGVMDNLRKLHGIQIDVVIVDYLELLLSRVPAYNKDDYTRQKRISTELFRLAKKENVLVVTATQTNRSGNENQSVQTNKKNAPMIDPVIDINKVAESYGKTMAMDYLVTINQTKQEYEAGKLDPSRPDSPNTKARCRFYVVKNRKGPKFVTINATINYETMAMREQEFGAFLDDSDKVTGDAAS